MTRSVERRRVPRTRVGAGEAIAFDGDAEVFFAEHRMSIRCTDISQSGMGLVVPSDIEIDGYVTIRFRLDGDWVSMVGAVVRAEPHRDGTFVAVQFTVVDTQTLQILDSYIRARVHTTEVPASDEVPVVHPFGVHETAELAESDSGPMNQRGATQERRGISGRQISSTSLSEPPPEIAPVTGEYEPAGATTEAPVIQKIPVSRRR